MYSAPRDACLFLECIHFLSGQKPQSATNIMLYLHNCTARTCSYFYMCTKFVYKCVKIDTNLSICAIRYVQCISPNLNPNI